VTQPSRRATAAQNGPVRAGRCEMITAPDGLEAVIAELVRRAVVY